MEWYTASAIRVVCKQRNAPCILMERNSGPILTSPSLPFTDPLVGFKKQKTTKTEFQKTEFQFEGEGETYFGILFHIAVSRLKRTRYYLVTQWEQWRVDSIWEQ